MLTAARARSAEAGARPYKLADGQGLFLHVAPTGLRTWRLRFRYQGREQLLVLGRFPELSLAEARDRRVDAQREIRVGRHPGRAAPIAGATFADVAGAWLAQQRGRWSEVHAADVAAALERHVLPELGALQICKIEASAVLQVLRRVEAAGAIVTARRLRQYIARIFRRAIAEDLRSTNPAAELGDALEHAPDPEHQAAIVDLDGARTAFAAIAAAGTGEPAGLAFRFLALTAARSAAVRGARWEEIEGVDWENMHSSDANMHAVWRIPAARMKVKRARKSSAAFDHVVPLPAAAMELLREARAAAAGSPLIFPRRGGGAAPTGVNALSDLHAAAGYRGRQTPHGWRATFSTILNERRPADRAAIDLALAHSALGKTEVAYNRSEQTALRRVLFEDWAHILLTDDIAA